MCLPRGVEVRARASASLRVITKLVDVQAMVASAEPCDLPSHMNLSLGFFETNHPCNGTVTAENCDCGHFLLYTGSEWEWWESKRGSDQYSWEFGVPFLQTFTK